MPDKIERDIGAAAVSNMTENVDDITTDVLNPEGAQDQEETRFQSKEWPTYFGQIKTVPEVAISLQTRSQWVVSVWDSPDIEGKAMLEGITGRGSESFTDVMKNMVTIKRANGDSFALITKSDKNILLNLRPLDPGKMVVIANRQGVITAYEQISVVKGKANKRYRPDEIFHLVNNRMADEILGTSDLLALQSIIQALKESFDDFKIVVHRNVFPLTIIYLDTDNPTEVAEYQVKYETTVNKKEVLFAPKDTVEVDRGGLASNATFNPLPWRNHLSNYFYQVSGVPQIVLGGAQEFSESASKVAYVAFQQAGETEQRYLEREIANQLQVIVKFEWPKDIQNELISDKQKDAGQATGFQQKDVTLGPESGT